MDQPSPAAARSGAPQPCPQCGNPDPSKIIKCPYCRYVPGTEQLRRAAGRADGPRSRVPALFLGGAIVEIIAIALLTATLHTKDAAAVAVVVVWALAALGGVLLLVASVAAGVSLGVRDTFGDGARTDSDRSVAQPAGSAPADDSTPAAELAEDAAEPGRP